MADMIATNSLGAYFARGQGGATGWRVDSDTTPLAITAREPAELLLFDLA